MRLLTTSAAANSLTAAQFASSSPRDALDEALLIDVAGCQLARSASVGAATRRSARRAGRADVLAACPRSQPMAALLAICCEPTLLQLCWMQARFSQPEGACNLTFSR